MITLATLGWMLLGLIGLVIVFFAGALFGSSVHIDTVEANAALTEENERLHRRLRFLGQRPNDGGISL